MGRGVNIMLWALLILAGLVASFVMTASGMD